MTPAADLLTRLRGAGVGVTTDGAEVRCRAAKGVLTPELVRELREIKPAVLALLTETEAGIAWRVGQIGDTLLTDAPDAEAGICSYCGAAMPSGQAGKCVRCCLASAALLDRRRIEGQATYPSTDLSRSIVGGIAPGGDMSHPAERSVT